MEQENNQKEKNTSGGGNRRRGHRGGRGRGHGQKSPSERENKAVAAEGAPAIFCTCDHCAYARKVGGREIRTRSGSRYRS